MPGGQWRHAAREYTLSPHTANVPSGRRAALRSPPAATCTKLCSFHELVEHLHSPSRDRGLCGREGRQREDRSAAVDRSTDERGEHHGSPPGMTRTTLHPRAIQRAASSDGRRHTARLFIASSSGFEHVPELFAPGPRGDSSCPNDLGCRSRSDHHQLESARNKVRRPNAQLAGTNAKVARAHEWAEMRWDEGRALLDVRHAVAIGDSYPAS
jgi:hypothetical protein